MGAFDVGNNSISMRKPRLGSDVIQRATSFTSRPKEVGVKQPSSFLQPGAENYTYMAQRTSLADMARPKVRVARSP